MNLNCFSHILLVNNLLLSVIPKYIKFIFFNCTKYGFEYTLRLTNSGDFFHSIHVFNNHGNFCNLSLMDMVVVDYPFRLDRFSIYYNFIISSLLSIRLFLGFSIMEFNYSEMVSISNIFRGAAWLEREIFDMFGIEFSGNCDLRRILTDYGFEGYPLRKDFPVEGYTCIRYDVELRCLISEPYTNFQVYKRFKFFNYW